MPDHTTTPPLIIRRQLRSRLLHAMVAEEIRRDPAILGRARMRVAHWCASSDLAEAHWGPRWQPVLAQDDATVCRALLRDDPEMTQLRAHSPFAGALTDSARARAARLAARAVPVD